MNLKFYIKYKKKVYTLKKSANSQLTSEAHYKFIKIRPVKEKTKSED